MTKLIASDVLIAGGGLAGIVTALEALRGGHVTGKAVVVC